MHVGITLTLTFNVCGPLAGHWIVLGVWQNPGPDQGISQSRELCSAVVFNVSAVLQCAVLAHGAPSWPGQAELTDELERMGCGCSSLQHPRSQPSVLVLAGGRAGRKELPGWGEEHCGTGDAGSWCQQYCQKQVGETQPAACTSTAICPAPAQLEQSGVSPPHWERYRSCCATLN